jgi:predicted P-loop ATPase
VSDFPITDVRLHEPVDLVGPLVVAVVNGYESAEKWAHACLVEGQKHGFSNGCEIADVIAAARSIKQPPVRPDSAVSAPARRSSSAVKKARNASPADTTASTGTLTGLIPYSKSNSTPANCEANALAIVRSMTAFDGIHFDTFHQRLMIEEGGASRSWLDEDDTKMVAHVQILIAPKMTANILHAAISVVARERARDALVTFVEALPTWDGTPRIEDFFIDVVGAADTPHVRAAGRNFFLALIARAMHPGCEVHFAVILEGEQGAGKNNLFKALMGEFYTEARYKIESVDFLRTLRGSWLVHMGELSAMRKSDVEAVKEILSANADEFVEKYERNPRRYLRRCVIVGSTNRDEYLTDATGNRRFIPVRCTSRAFRVDLVEANRLQLLAEAAHRIRAGEAWHEWPTDTVQEQANRVIHDSWDESIAAHLAGRNETTVREVLSGPLDIELERHTRSEQTRVAETLRKFGWRATKRVRIEGIQTTSYVRPQ